MPSFPFVCLHMRSYGLISLHLPTPAFKFLHFPSFNSICLHLPPHAFISILSYTCLQFPSIASICLPRPSFVINWLHLHSLAFISLLICFHLVFENDAIRPSAFNFLYLPPFAFLALYLSSSGSIYLHLPSHPPYAFIYLHFP